MTRQKSVWGEANDPTQNNLCFLEKGQFLVTHACMPQVQVPREKLHFSVLKIYMAPQLPFWNLKMFILCIYVTLKWVLVLEHQHKLYDSIWFQVPTTSVLFQFKYPTISVITCIHMYLVFIMTYERLYAAVIRNCQIFSRIFWAEKWVFPSIV